MGRSETPDVAKVFVLASRRMDLHKAWEKCGSPTTWGNVQRRFKAAQPAAPAAATAASRPAAGSSRARQLLADAGGVMSTPAQKQRSSQPPSLPSRRAGASTQRKVRATPHQVEVGAGNEARRRRAYVEVYI